MSPRASWKRIRYSHARNLFGFIAYSSRCTIGSLRRYLCTRVGAQILSLGRPFEGRPVASKGLGPLPTMRGSALAHGCGRGGRVVLRRLARAAAVWTGVRGLEVELRGHRAPHLGALHLVRGRVRHRVKA